MANGYDDTDHLMAPYDDTLVAVLEHGVKKGDRTGTGTRSIFGYQTEYDLGGAFPLVTGKRVFWKAIVHELIWFLKGETNIKYLEDNGVTIWREWADKTGELGPVYGKQWRSWVSPELGQAPDGAMRNVVIDQIANVIEQIKKNPDSRRHIVTAWNPADVDDMALPPCHCLFQFYVAEGKLSCQLYQRSADLFLGVPFNIASYALLTLIIAKLCGLKPGKFVHTLGDAHIYDNHIEQVELYLERVQAPGGAPACPMVLIGELDSIDDLTAEHVMLMDYRPLPAISAPVAV